ncbi:MAG TPA: hypothetical protein VGJ48_05725, partial [Pyrinomonadaceae bacterium]
ANYTLSNPGPLGSAIERGGLKLATLFSTVSRNKDLLNKIGRRRGELNHSPSRINPRARAAYNA